MKRGEQAGTCPPLSIPMPCRSAPIDRHNAERIVAKEREMPKSASRQRCNLLLPIRPEVLVPFAPFKGLPKNICKAEDIRVVVESFYEESNERQRSHQT